MPIELHPYEPQWASFYEEVKLPLSVALGSYARDIQHVGSTSIQGIVSKPVIDIAVAIDQYPLPDEVVQAVANLGYEYRGEYGIPQRHYFTRPVPPIAYQVHINSPANNEFQNHVLFRDYLRAHPEAAREYESLKQELAARHADDKEAYSDDKGEFVQDKLVKAHAWRDGQETPPVSQAPAPENTEAHGEGGERSVQRGIDKDKS